MLPLLAVLGPGLIVAAADNDAGGITTYSVVGAQFGYSILWVLVLTTISLSVTQELGARAGIVTGKGLASLIRERFGVRWTAFALLATMAASLGTTTVEFAGIAASMELFGLTRYVSVPLAAIFVFLLVTRGSYKRVERVFLLAIVFYFAYAVSAYLAGPDWGAALRGTFVPTIKLESAYVVAVIATVGTTITPWGQYFIQSYVVDKRLSPDDLAYERVDVLSGSIFVNLIAGFIILTTAATLWTEGRVITEAQDAALALVPFAGRFASVVFGVGLFAASLLGAAIVPMSSSYVLCEGLGFEAGVDHSAREAPWFYGTFGFFIVFGAVLVLLKVPLVTLAIFSQTVNAIFLIPVLIFLLKLTNDEEVMGKYVNTPIRKGIAGLTVAGLVLLSTLLIFTTFFGL